MKRFVLPLAVLIGLAGAGLYILKMRAPHVRAVASWLPAGTILFEDVPDIHRTRERWPGTALAKIINEPEVQAFLEEPLELVPGRGDIVKEMGRVDTIDPEQFFLAVTEWAGSGTPTAVAGLRYAGKKDEVDGLIAELRKAAQTRWPEGKSDIEQYGGGEIETFSAPGFSAGLAYRGDWVFLATDTELLKGTLDRYAGKSGMGDSLEDLAVFKNCLGHLPTQPDNVFFVRPVLLADKMASLAMMLNPTGDVNGADSLKKVDAIGMGMKLDGELMRDATFIMKESPGDASPLEKDVLKLSTPDTIIAADERVQGLDEVKMPDPKADQTGVLQLLASYVKVFADQGLGSKEVMEAFGPEAGFVLDWPAGTQTPMPLAAVDVKDKAMAQKFLDTLTKLPIAAGVSFTREDMGDNSYYSLPPTGMGLVPLQVTLGLSGKCVIGGLSTGAVRAGMGRWDAGSGGLAGTDIYKKAADLVVAPTLSYSYVDAKGIFERVYGLLRQVALMGVIPHEADYVDITKLPQTETISRHLSPMVSSGAVKDGGMLMESAGPVTMTQAGIVTVIGVGAAAIERFMKGQSVPVQGFPPAGMGSGQGGSSFSFHPRPPTLLPPGGLASPTASPSGGSQ